MAKRTAVKKVEHEVTKLDPAMIQSSLNVTPKGAYYNTADEQLKVVQGIWEGFFKFDRVLFSLFAGLLKGTAYAKGRMSYILLSNPQTPQEIEKLPDGLPSDFEGQLISYMLDNETTPRSLKNLIMLTGGKRDKKTGEFAFKQINNARSRKLILQFIFDRPAAGLDSLAVKYKTKVRRLVKHAIGERNLKAIINLDDQKFQKYVGRYNPSALPVILHLFDLPLTGSRTFYPKINLYYELREAAKSGDIKAFQRIAKTKALPLETLLGFRNTYKLDVPLKTIHESGKMSERQKLQMESASKKVGAKVKVDYTKQELLDLLKAFYAKVVDGNKTNIDKIVASIDDKSEEKSPIGFGETVVILDVSHSMRGSAKRPLHPFLVSMSILATLDNVKKVIYSGGTWITTPSKKWPLVIYPNNETNLWKSLIEAAKLNPESVVVISDGYENAPMKGMFEQVYNKLQEDGHKFDLIHINPVFASESGGAKRLVSDAPMLPVSDHKGLETAFISNMLLSHPERVKGLLVQKYSKLLSAKGKSS